MLGRDRWLVCRRTARRARRGARLASTVPSASSATEGTAALELVGEPGIGKTRLLAELATRADAADHSCSRARASELERDLPFWVFVDALDEYVRGLDPRLLDLLDADVRAELAQRLPVTVRASRTRTTRVQHERYRTHRAVRELLERLTATRPLVLDPRRRPLGRPGIGRAARIAAAPATRRGGADRARGPPAAAAGAAAAALDRAHRDRHPRPHRPRRR